jgi:hypothetical protein
MRILSTSFSYPPSAHLANLSKQKKRKVQKEIKNSQETT